MCIKLQFSVFYVHIAAMLTGLCVPIFGPRLTVMTGSLITSVGYLATSFVYDINIFFLTYGMMCGIGISCMAMGSVVLLYEYFDKHKALALGLLMTFYSIGYFVWPPFVTVLFSHYGWRGSFIIIAGVQLHGCVFGAFLRPFRTRNVTANKVEDKASVCSKFLSQGKVFQKRYFMIFCLITMFVYTGYSFAPAYLPTMAEQLGTSETSAALLVSVFGKLQHSKY